MQRNLNQLRLHALVSAMTIFCGSCGWDREPARGAGSGNEPAPVAGSGDKPAQVVLLTDEAAQSFLDGTWPASGARASPPPEVGRVVVAGGDEGVVFAYVLGSNEAEARRQLDRITVSGDIPGCVAEGDTCCDRENGVFVLDGEFEGERSWRNIGLSCKPSPVQEGSTGVGEPPADWPRFDFVEVRPDIWNAMAERGVTHPFMTLPKDNGELQVLVDPSEQTSELWNPPAMHSPRFQGGVPIIPAHHPGPPPRLPNNCADSVVPCTSAVGYLGVSDQHPVGTPHRARHHWYAWRQARQKWCELPLPCLSCPPPD